MVMEWRDIASAPKDGTMILLWEDRDRVSSVSTDRPPMPPYVGGWRDGDWYYCLAGWLRTYDDYFGDSLSPTHWMPLPAPPTDCAPQGFVRPEVMEE